MYPCQAGKRLGDRFNLLLCMPMQCANDTAWELYPFGSSHSGRLSFLPNRGQSKLRRGSKCGDVALSTRYIRKGGPIDSRQGPDDGGTDAPFEKRSCC